MLESSSPDPPSGAAFARGADTGDALERLLSEADWLYSCALRLGYGPGAADDAVQETLLLAAREGEPGRGWLRTALRRRLGMDRRAASRRRAREALVARLEASEVSPSAALERVELGARVREAIQSLPLKDREVLVLRFFADMAPREIAETLGVSPNAVSSRLSRALAEVRRRLDPAEGHGASMFAWLTWPAWLRPTKGRAVTSSTPSSTFPLPTLAVAALMKPIASITGVALLALLGSAWLLGRGGASVEQPMPADDAHRSAPIAPVDLADESQKTATVAVDEVIDLREQAVLETALASEAPAASVELAVTGEVQITVTEAETGRPAPGVFVELVRFHGGPHWNQKRSGTTDDGGTLTFSDLTPGRRYAYLGRVGPTGDFASEGVDIRAGETSKLTFVVDGQKKITGRVVDEWSRPVSDAAIWIGRGQGATVSGSIATTSDRSGRFEVPYASEMQMLSASAPGYAPSPSRALRFADDGSTDLVLTLGSRFGTVRGTVRGPKGRALEDVLITLGSACRPLRRDGKNTLKNWTVPLRTVRSGPGGAFEFTHVPDGDHLLEARAPDSALFSRTVHVPDRGIAETAIELLAGGHLFGEVRYSDGRPAADAHLAFVYQSPLLGRVELTADQNGEYSVEHVTPGTRQIEISDSAQTAKILASVEILNGVDTRQDFIVTERPPLKGHAYSEAGEPLGEWLVTSTAVIDGATNGVSLGMQTGADGAFEFHPEAGERFLLEVFAPGRWGRDPLLTLRDVEQDGQDLRLVISDDVMPSASLRGQVVDEAGAAIQGAAIEVELKSSFPVFLEAESDAGGFFNVQYLSEGACTITITAKGRATKVLEQARPFEQREFRDLGQIKLLR
ncbi:MAG: sigma-70 family RNA polymerase sigma factor [Planctomycetota bacterium]